MYGELAYETSAVNIPHLNYSLKPPDKFWLRYQTNPVPQENLSAEESPTIPFRLQRESLEFGATTSNR